MLGLSFDSCKVHYQNTQKTALRLLSKSNAFACLEQVKRVQAAAEHRMHARCQRACAINAQRFQVHRSWKHIMHVLTQRLDAKCKWLLQLERRRLQTLCKGAGDAAKQVHC